MTKEEMVKSELVKLTALTMQFDGARKQYSAAVLSQDNQQADVFRSRLHEILDMMLDSDAVSMSITRQLMGGSADGQTQ